MTTSIRLGWNEFQQIIQEPKYKAIKIEDYNRVEAYEKWNGGASIPCLFEAKLAKGQVATMREFVEHQLEEQLKLFGKGVISYSKTSHRAIKVDENLKNNIRARAARTYVSKLVELEVALALRSKFSRDEMSIYTYTDMDTVLGVDIVVEYKRELYYLHIFKDSYWGHKARAEKATRKGYDNETGRTFQREEGPGHIDVVFDEFAKRGSKTTQFINGLPLIKPDYLVSLLANTEGDKLEGATYLEKFLNWQQEGVKTVG